MATTEILNGTTLTLAVDGVVIGSTTSHSFSPAMETRDATTKDSEGWEEVLGAMKSWGIDFEAFVNYSETFGFSELFALISARTKVTLLFTNEETGDPEYSGEAFLTGLSKEAPVEDSVTMSGSFKGTGAITEATQT